MDLVLILQHETPSIDRLNAAVDATFRRRGTHSVPEVVSEPPSDWAKPFAILAADCRLDHTVATAHERVQAFWRHLRS